MTRPRRRAALFVGAVALALLTSGCGLISLQSLPKLGGVSGRTFPVHAVFADVLNLPTNAQVRLGAQVVGQVSSISAHDFTADVTLSVKEGVRLPVGTTAEVRFDNPLGDEYVLLRPPPNPSATLLVSGSTVPEADTSIAPSVEDTFGALSLVLNGGGLNQLQTVVKELNNTFTGNQPQIHDLLGSIDTAVSSLAGGRQAVDDALGAIQTLSANLNANGGAQTIAGGIDAAAPAVTILSQANTQISALLQSLNTLGSTGVKVAQTSGQNGVNDLKDLLPVVNQLVAVDQQIQPDLQAVSAFEAATPKVAPGGYLQVSVIANVVLPPGPSDATPGSTGFSSVAAPAPSTGAAAIGELLGQGLL